MPTALLNIENAYFYQNVNPMGLIRQQLAIIKESTGFILRGVFKKKQRIIFIANRL